jgi:hypothetical protein
MAFLAGDLLTAQRANRLQAKSYYRTASGTVPASSTNADVPGVTATFTTETNGATVDCTWVTDFDLSGAVVIVGASRLLLDSVTASDNSAIFGGEISTDRGTCAQTNQFTIPTAGVHTIKMQATTPANMTINTHTTMTLVVREIV